MSGYGYYDSADYEPKPDETKWIIENVLPKGFGFIAGLPKGSNSPHGGKSVYFRQMAYSIITGKPFLGNKVLQQGNVLVVNIDESIDDQIMYFRRLCGGSKVAGFKVSKARSLTMPDDLKILQEDIEELKPVFCNIDPLLRTTGGKDIQQSKDTAPIMNKLKLIYEATDCTIALNHHSQKAEKRNKESSATWLNGSVDLDSAWDFCIGIEWAKAPKNPDPADKRFMHARCFMRKKPLQNLYYIATANEDSEIHGLRYVPDEIKHNPLARKVFFAKEDNPLDSMYAISQKSNVAQSTVKDYFGKFECLKKLGHEGAPKVDTSVLSKNDSVSDTKNPISEIDVSSGI